MERVFLCYTWEYYEMCIQIDGFQMCGINDHHTQKLVNVETGNKCRTLCMVCENSSNFCGLL